jgi:hypothetical protein
MKTIIQWIGIPVLLLGLKMVGKKGREVLANKYLEDRPELPKGVSVYEMPPPVVTFQLLARWSQLASEQFPECANDFLKVSSHCNAAKELVDTINRRHTEE